VERNRLAVLAAARRVFLDKGYAGASLEAISEEAGFSKGVVYSQFGSKADLFFALLDRRIDERAAQDARIADELSGAEAIWAILVAGGRDAVAEQGWARLLVEFRVLAARDPALNGRYASANARAVRQFAAVLERLHDRGGLQPAVPARSMAEFILAVASGFAIERLADHTALDIDDVMVLMCRALGLPEPTRARPALSRRAAARRPSG
jgi:AcrR family transcriptional regulator